MTSLPAFVADALAQPVPAAVRAAAVRLSDTRGSVVVLFYGSVLRTGALGDILDFYVLTDAPAGGPARLWPDVGYREMGIGGETIRAKIATMPLAAFMQAAAGAGVDTTIWTRFCQPSALVWSRDAATTALVIDAVSAAVTTAARFAALHGPAAGAADAYWRALFAATYDTELRFEARGRGDGIVARAPSYFADALPLAWTAGGIGFARAPDGIVPEIDQPERERLRRRWRRLRRAGKPLNAARLVKAAFTFEGASAYALYKLARHTGVVIPLTPWRARHPLLAAPGVLWRVWRAR